MNFIGIMQEFYMNQFNSIGKIYERETVLAFQTYIPVFLRATTAQANSDVSFITR